MKNYDLFANTLASEMSKNLEDNKKLFEPAVALEKLAFSRVADEEKPTELETEVSQSLTVEPSGDIVIESSAPVEVIAPASTESKLASMITSLLKISEELDNEGLEKFAAYSIKLADALVSEAKAKSTDKSKATSKSKQDSKKKLTMKERMEKLRKAKKSDKKDSKKSDTKDSKKSPADSKKKSLVSKKAQSQNVADAMRNVSDTYALSKQQIDGLVGAADKEMTRLMLHGNSIEFSASIEKITVTATLDNPLLSSATFKFDVNPQTNVEGLDYGNDPRVTEQKLKLKTTMEDRLNQAWNATMTSTAGAESYTLYDKLKESAGHVPSGTYSWDYAFQTGPIVSFDTYDSIAKKK